jgi:hypothetical protein
MSEESKKVIEDELKLKLNEVEAVIESLVSAVDSLNIRMEQHSQNLDNSLNQLNEEIFVLSTLPLKVGEYLNLLVPAISQELHNQVFIDLDRGLEKRGKILDDLNIRAESTCTRLEVMLAGVNELVEQAKGIQTSQLKQKIKAFAILSLAMIVLSLGASYMMVKSLPTNVWLSAKGDVHIDDSSVVVRKSDNLKVYDNNKKKS